MRDMKEELYVLLCKAHSAVTDDCFLKGKTLSYGEHLKAVAEQLVADNVTVREEPKTMADRIRSMSDEELAKAFYDLYIKISVKGSMNDLSDLFCDGKAGCITKRGNIRCSVKKEKACVLRFLQQPAKEGS